MKYEETLLKYAKEAFDKGKELHFIVRRYDGKRVWRIKLVNEIAFGEEETLEED